MNTKSAWPRLGPIPAGLTALFLCYCAPGIADETPSVAVRTATLQYGVIAQPVQAYGVIGSAPGGVAAVNLPYTARIVQLRVQSGQSVARGAVLFVAQADPAAVTAAKQAVTALKLAQEELARTQALYAQSLATQSQLDMARKASSDAKSALEAQQALGIGSDGRVTAAAPADGVVTQINVSQGDQVQAGGPILQLALRSAGPQSAPNVTLGVDPAVASRIHAGDPVVVSGLSSAPDNAQGQVVIVGAAVDPLSQLVNVGATVPLGNAGLLPGMHVKADISTRAGKHWIIPRSALLRDSQGAYVFQVSKDQHARRVAVAAQIENGDAYGVDGVLDATQSLVVTGNYELRDGDAVRVETGNLAGDQAENQSGVQQGTAR